MLRLDGENVLCVEIRPVLARARSRSLDYPAGLVAEGSGFESLYVRKAPHMFGWDIMPRAVPAGIWRPVTLRFLPAERLERVFLETETSRGQRVGGLALHRRAFTDGAAARYEVEVRACGDSRF